MKCPAGEVLLTWAEQAPGAAEHLVSCRRCELQVQRLRALAAELGELSLARPAPGFTSELEQRIALARPVRVRKRGLLLAAAAAAVIAMLGLRNALPPDASGTFSARGSPSAKAQRLGFEVYVHEPGRPALLLAQGQALSAAAGYSFVVWNRSHVTQRLMLFAVDAQREVHWFYPSFVEPASDPQSIEISALPEVRALPEGVTPEHAALGPIQFVGVFTSAALRVSSVEARIRESGLDALRRSPDVTAIQVLRAEVHGP